MLQHQTNSQNNLTFLKSNYKYKRRNILTMRALPACCVARTPNQLAATLSKTDSKTSAAATSTATVTTTTTIARKCSTILSLFIVIIWKVLQAAANCCLRYAGRIIANADDHENAYAYVFGHDHDVNATAVRHLQLVAFPQSHSHSHLHSHTHTRTTHAEDDANDEVSTAREQQQQQQHQRQQQHLSSSSLQKSSNSLTTTAAAATTTAATSSATTTTRVVMLSAAKSRLPLMTLLIALLLSMRLTSAGTCWQTHLGSGKCNKIFSTNITKSDCCGVSQTFSYTDRELSSVEYFFATAIGGGVECAPCIESCKGFKCGPNKKCVKRKGRPKCVCAPECGATLRRKHQLQQQQQQQQHHIVAEQQSWQPPKSSALLLSAMPPRGSRSLISEITNANLGLDGAKRQSESSSNNNSNGTDNQRNQLQEKPMPMPKRTSRRRGMLGETKHRRLLIIDSSSNSNLQEQPTTRRLHMEGNGNGNGGRVQMQIKAERETEWEKELEMERLAPIRGYDRRRHRKNNSSSNNNNNSSSSNNNGKHLTRSMTTLASTTTTTTTAVKVTAMATGANDSSSTTPAQTAQSRHKLANANEPANDINRQQQQQQQLQQKDNAPARVRHQHQQQQQQQQLAPNHEQYDNGSQQRRHKHKHNHKDKPHTAATAAATAEGILLTANTTMSGSGSESGTGSGSGTGARRRLYLAEHGSETAASSGTSSGSSSSNSHLANTDDLTFLAGIYEAAPMVQQQQQQQQHHTNPVCGNDGRTYNTECQLRKRACRTNNAQLEVAYRGHCKTSCNGVQCVNGLTCVEDQYMMPHCIVCKIDCPWDDDDDVDDESAAYDLDSDEAKSERQQRRAVCGVDGKTYRSTCDINRMICKIGRSIAVAYPGPCRADHVTCADIKCGPKDTCLIDLRTHMPRCVSCRYKCARKQQRTQFRADKICGNNNHTYNSWCEMRKDSCATGYFIGVRSTGVC